MFLFLELTNSTSICEYLGSFPSYVYQCEVRTRRSHVIRTRETHSSHMQGEGHGEDDHGSGVEDRDHHSRLYLEDPAGLQGPEETSRVFGRFQMTVLRIA